MRQVGFWVEYDTGTEPLHRLVAKIDPYQRYRQIGGADYPVLFVLPNPTRETNLHRLMEHDHDHGSLSATASTTTPVSVAVTNTPFTKPPRRFFPAIDGPPPGPRRSPR